MEILEGDCTKTNSDSSEFIDKLDIVEDYLESMDSNKVLLDKELNAFFFTRSLEGDKKTHAVTVFEKILATPGACDLIEVIWNKFNLSTREEIFSLVSDTDLLSDKQFILLVTMICVNRKTHTASICCTTSWSRMTTTI